jgi:hypothetical protein
MVLGHGATVPLGIVSAETSTPEGAGVSSRASPSCPSKVREFDLQWDRGLSAASPYLRFSCEWDISSVRLTGEALVRKPIAAGLFG